MYLLSSATVFWGISSSTNKTPKRNLVNITYNSLFSAIDMGTVFLVGQTCEQELGCTNIYSRQAIGMLGFSYFAPLKTNLVHELKMQCMVAC